MKKNYSNIKFILTLISLLLPFEIYSITQKDVLTRLTWDHGPEWQSLLGRPPNEQNALRVKRFLFEIAEQKINYEDYEEFKDLTPYLRSIAISELGNFSQINSPDSREVLSYLKEVFEKNKNTLYKNSIDHLMNSIITSISNIGTPEAIAFLASQIANGSSVYDSILVQSIEAGLNGREGLKINTDFKSDLVFAPNTYLPYEKRTGDFTDSIKEYRTKLSSLARSPDTPRSLKNTARLTNLNFSKKITFLPQKTKARSPSSISKEKEQVTSAKEQKNKIKPELKKSSFPYTLSFGLFIILLLIFLYKNKKK
jgi:hypothetical protein